MCAIVYSEGFAAMESRTARLCFIILWPMCSGAPILVAVLRNGPGSLLFSFFSVQKVVIGCWRVLVAFLSSCSSRNRFCTHKKGVTELPADEIPTFQSGRWVAKQSAWPQQCWRLAIYLLRRLDFFVKWRAFECFESSKIFKQSIVCLG